MALCCAVVLFLIGVAGAADFSNWASECRITFRGYDPPDGATPLTNIPLLVTLNTTITNFDYSQFASPDGYDLRFSDSTRTTELAYEIDRWYTAGNSYIWVRVPVLTDSNTYIYAFWGNPAAASAPAYSTNGTTWSEGYQGVWHLEETGNDDRHDSSVNTNTGSAQNDQAPLFGIVGRCDDFNGDDIVRASDHPSLDTGSNCTLELWFKADTLATPYQVIACKSTYWMSDDCGMHLNNANLEFWYDHGRNTDYTAVQPSTWHYAVGTYNGASRLLYVDGERKQVSLLSGAVNNNGYDFTIGQDHDGSTYFDGKIDEVRISNVARSTNWVWACWFNMLSNGVFNTYSSVGNGPWAVVNNDEGATDMTLSTATLNGYIGSTGQSPTTAYVYWGISDGGTNELLWSNSWSSAAGRPVGPVSHGVTDLESDRIHYYRFAVENAAGKSWAVESSSFLPGEVYIVGTQTNASEDGDIGEVTFCRPAAAATGPLTISYTIGAGSTAQSSDYELSPSNDVTMLTGQTSAVVTLTAENDGSPESMEKVIIELSPGRYVLGQSQTIVYIRDHVVRYYDKQTGDWTAGTTWESADEAGDDAGPPGVGEGGEIDEATVSVTAANQIDGKYVFLKSSGVLRADANATDYWKGGKIYLEGGTAQCRITGDNYDRTVGGDFWVVTNSTISARQNEDRDNDRTLGSLRFEKLGNQVVNLESGETPGNNNRLIFPSVAMGKAGTVNLTNEVEGEFRTITGSGRLTKTGNRPLYITRTNPNFSGGFKLNQGSVYADAGTDGVVGTIGSGSCEVEGGYLRARSSYCFHDGTINLRSGGTLRADGNAYHYFSGARINLKGGTVHLQLTGDNYDRSVRGDFYVYTNATFRLRQNEDRDNDRHFSSLRFVEQGNHVVTLESGETVGNENQARFYNVYMNQAGTVLCTNSVDVQFDAITGSGRLTKTGDRPLYIYGKNVSFSGGVTVEQGTVYPEQACTLSEVGALGTGLTAIETGAVIHVSSVPYGLNQAMIDIMPGGRLYAYEREQNRYELGNAEINLKGGVLDLRNRSSNLFGGNVNVVSDSEIRLRTQDSRTGQSKGINTLTFLPGPRTLTVTDPDNLDTTLRIENPISLINDAILDGAAKVDARNVLSGSGTLTKRGNDRLYLRANSPAFDGTIVIESGSVEGDADNSSGPGVLGSGTTIVKSGAQLRTLDDDLYVFREATINVESNGQLYAYRRENSSYNLRGATINLRGGKLTMRNRSSMVFGGDVNVISNSTIELTTQDNRNDQTKTIDRLNFGPGPRTLFVTDPNNHNNYLRVGTALTVTNDATIDLEARAYFDGTVEIASTLTKTGPDILHLNNSTVPGQWPGVLRIAEGYVQGVRIDCINDGTVEVVNGGTLRVDEDVGGGTAVLRGGTVILRDGGRFRYDNGDYNNKYVEGSFEIDAGTCEFDVYNGNRNNSRESRFSRLTTCASGGTVQFRRTVNGGNQAIRFNSRSHIYHDLTCDVGGNSPTDLNGTYHYRDATLTKAGSGTLYIEQDINVKVNGGADLLDDLQPWTLITNSAGTINNSATFIDCDGLWTQGGGVGAGQALTATPGNVKGTNGVFSSGTSFAAEDAGIVEITGVSSGAQYTFEVDLANVVGGISNVVSNVQGNPIWDDVMAVDVDTIRCKVTPRKSGSVYFIWDNVVSELDADVTAVRVPFITNGDGATNVTPNSAYLTGELFSNMGLDTTVFVYWGQTDGDTDAAAWANTNSWTSASAGFFSHQVGLTAGKNYFYRFSATNANGRFWAGSSEAFSTAEVRIDTLDRWGNETPGDTIQFSAVRAGGATEGDLTVNLSFGGSAENGVDYDALFSPVVIPDGFSNVLITVNPIVDADGEIAESVSVSLAPGPYRIGTPSLGTGTIADDDIEVVIQPVSGIDGSGATLNGEVIATGGAPNPDVYFCWGTSDPGTISTGAWDYVTSLGANWTNNSPFSTNVTLSSTAMYYYRSYVTNDAGDDWSDTVESFTRAEINVGVLDGSATEGGDTAAFFVYRPANCTNGALTVNYAVSGDAIPDSDYTALSGSVLIPIGATSATIVVAAIDDVVLSEDPETVQVTLISGKYRIGAQDTASVDVIDNDGDAENWPYRMKIVFNGYTKSETLTDFPVPIILGTNLADKGFSYDLLASRANGADILFLSADTTEVLPHEFEHWGGDTNTPPGPDTLSGLAFWADASDVSTLTTNGTGQVLQWDDKSGHGRHMDDVLGTPYVVTDGPNGKTVIGFDGDGDVICTTTNFDGILSQYTIFTVARYTGGDNARVISSRTRNWLFGFHSNGDERWHAEAWIHNDGTANTNWHLHTGTINNDSDPKAAFWKDGTLLTSNDTGSHNTNYKPGRIQAGGYQTSSECSKCEVAEIIMYDRVLSATERERVEFYLESKYAVNRVVDASSYLWVKVPELYEGAYIWMYWGNPVATNRGSYTEDGSVWANGFVGVYHMSDAVKDSGPNHIDGIRESAASRTAGMLGGGYDVGSGGHLDLTADPAWDVIDSANKNTWTMSLWVNPDTTASDGCLISQYSGSFLWWLDTGGIDNYVFFDNGGGRTPEGSGIAAQSGAWQYVTVRKSGGTIRLYVDTAFSGSCSGDIDPSDLPFSIGTEHGDTTARGFDGQFDEARISDKPRSEDWIWAEWASMVSPLTFLTNGPVQSSVAPDVVDGGITELSAAAAKFNGTLVSTGGSATAVFVYWDNVDHGTNLTWPNSFKWESPVSEGTYSYKAVDLLPDTEYHYRFSATNAAGRVWTVGKSSFTTPEDPFNWQYKMKITFSGYAGSETLEDFPALIRFDTGMTNFYSGFAGPQWYELRFMDAGSSGFLNYEVDTWDAASNSHVWVQVPEIENNESYIWAYWGNAAQTSAPAVYTTNGAVWSDYQAVYHMNELGTGARFDSTANGYHSYPQNYDGDEGTAAGIVGGADILDGLSNYLAISGMNYSQDGEINTITVSAWAKSSSGNEQILCSFDRNEVWRLALMDDDASGVAWDTMGYGDGVDDQRVGGSHADGQWHHVAATYAAVEGNNKSIYVDGESLLSAAAHSGARLVDFYAGSGDGGPQYGFLGVGSEAETYNGSIGPTYYLSGHLDECRICDKARSADWIAAEWGNVSSYDTFCTHDPAKEQKVYWVWSYVDGITTNSALVHGRLGGTNANVYLFWDSADRGEDASAWANTNFIGADLAPGIIGNMQVTGLLSGFKYVYRLLATNNSTGRKDWSTPEQFVTIGAMGVNNGGGATDIEVTSARLNAGLTIENGTADLYTYWGTSDGGDDKNAWQYVITNGVGVGEGSYFSDVSGLYWGIRYYYRVYATNANGQAWAESSESFLTRSHIPHTPGQRGLLVRCYDSENGMSYIDPPDAPGGFFNAVDEGRTTNFNENIDYASFTAFPGITSDDSLGILWHGYFLPDETTTYSFALDSNNGSTIYIDNNRDGDYQDVGERVVGTDLAIVEGDVYLTAGTFYPIAISFYEGNGSQHMRARWKKGAGLTYDEQDWINPSNSPFYHRSEVIALDVVNDGVSGITAASAVFSGTIYGLDSVFDVYAHWGTVDAGEDAGAWQSSAFIGSYTNALPGDISYEATGLQDDRDYFFTFRAVNDATNMWSSSKPFRTLEDLRKWPYRMKITLTGYNRPAFLNDFPMLVKLNESLSGFAYSQFGSTNGYDLRFGDATETQVLDYETENWDTNGTSHVWVKIPQITGPTTYIWAYWGRSDVTQPAYATDGSTWSAGYLAVWHMNETSGPHRDSTGNGNWANPSNGVTQDLTGFIDGYDSFDDTQTNFMQIAENGTLDLSGAFTIETWYAPDRATHLGNDSSWLFSKSDVLTSEESVDVMIQSANGGGAGVLELWVNDTGQGAGRNTLRSSAVLNLSTGQWTHIAATKNGTAGALYQNGVRLDDDGTALDAAVFQNDVPVEIGIDAVSETMHGGVDEYRVSSVARNEHWLWTTFQCVVSNDTLLTYGAVDGSPTVRTLPPTDVTRTGAVFNGRLDRPGLDNPTVYLCWGSYSGGTASTGDWEFVENLGSTWSVGEMFTNAVTLLPNYNYYYRCYAENSYGGSWAAQQYSFSTAEIEVKATDPVVDELSGGTAELMVHRPITATNQNLTVYYTVGGDAEPDLDYEALSGTVVIPAGSTSAVITVTPLTDQIVMEPDETVSVTLSAGAYFIGAASTAYVTITDKTRIDLTPWRGVMKIRFSGYDVSTPLTNFPALVRFSDGLADTFKYEDCKVDGSDLRFMSGDGSQVLSYEIEDWNVDGESPVWVNVPLISSSNDYIWAYWSNKDAQAPGYTTDGSAWNADYLAVYHLTEASVVDSSANGFDATSVEGNPEVVSPGVIGPSLEMDRLQEVFTSVTYNDDPVTMSLWTKNEVPTVAAEESYLALPGVMVVQHQQSFKLRVTAMIGGVWEEVSLDPALHSGENYIVGTFDGTTLRLHLDGVEIASLGGLSGGLANATSARLSDRLKAVRDVLDECRISKTARSADWIRAEYLNQKPSQTFVTFGEARVKPPNATVIWIF